MLAPVALLCGAVPMFFWGLYRSSRAGGAWSAWGWGGFAVANLACVAVATILLTVPGFFA